MARGILGIVLLLALATKAGWAGHPAADEPQRQKAADHATVEADRARSGSAQPDKGSITWPGMTRDGSVLLPNGWSLKPAGQQARLGDLPVQMAMHPTASIL